MYLTICNCLPASLYFKEKKKGLISECAWKLPLLTGEKLSISQLKLFFLVRQI
jgi:hypothetical protein